MSINRNWRGTKTERNETIAKEGSRQAASSSSTPGLETELARGPLRRARETPVDNPRTPSTFLPPVYCNPLLCPTIVDVATALRLPCILDSRRPRSHPSPPSWVRFPPSHPRASPSSQARHFGVGREQGGGRWTRYITTDVCVVPVAQQRNRPYTTVCSHSSILPPSFFPRSPFARGCNPLHSTATAQLLDGSPGEATNLREPGRYVRRGEDRRVGGESAGSRGGWICATESTCTRASGLMSEPRWIRQGRNDLIPAFNPSFYLRIDIRLYIVCSSLSGTLPRNRLNSLDWASLFFLAKIEGGGRGLLPPRDTLLSKLSIAHAFNFASH